MSGDLDITSGGAISVNTEALYDTAAHIRAVLHDVDEASESLRRVANALSDPQAPVGLATAVSPWRMHNACEGAGERLRRAAVGTARMADAFALVELRAAYDLAVVSDPLHAAALRAEIAEWEAADPTLAAMARSLEAQRSAEAFEGVQEAPDLLKNGWGLSLWAAVLGISAIQSPLRPGEALRGPAPAVAVKPLERATPLGPPRSLAESLSRFPTGAAQVKVEKYTMPDASRQFVVYVAGTQAVAGRNPWDMTSNLQLYGGVRSASYQATVDALRVSGAQKGDVVHIAGHSQGGMIAANLASDDEFTVKTVITMGSPVEPSLPSDVLSVQLRHTDDLVSALAGEGSAGTTGSPDSFIARRDGDPSSDAASIDAHLMLGYRETAQQVDASGDPRVQAVYDRWRALEEAASIESTEFVAERPEER